MQLRAILKQKNRDVITIRPDTTVAEAVAELDRQNIGSLPVIDASGRICGIFTERDVLRGLHRQGKDFCHAAIGTVMTRDVVCCSAEDTVHDAMGRMTEHQIGQVPVTEDGILIGLVSIGDLVRVLYESAEESNRQLMSYVYGAV